MSVLSPDVHAALAQLLQGLQSADNTARSAAEENLSSEWVSKRPEMLLVGLAEQMQGANDESVSANPLDTTRRMTCPLHTDTY